MPLDELDGLLIGSVGRETAAFYGSNSTLLYEALFGLIFTRHAPAIETRYAATLSDATRSANAAPSPGPSNAPSRSAAARSPVRGLARPSSVRPAVTSPAACQSEPPGRPSARP